MSDEGIFNAAEKDCIKVAVSGVEKNPIDRDFASLSVRVHKLSSELGLGKYRVRINGEDIGSTEDFKNYEIDEVNSIEFRPYDVVRVVCA